MTARRVLALLVVTSLFVLPTLASSAIVEKWHTASGVNYHVISRYGNLNDEGTYHLVTGETSGSNERIGIRSASTGALLAQSALAYYVNGIWARDLEADGDIELIVWDGNTGKVNCFDYTTGSSTLAVRWSYLPFPAGGVFDMQFVNFDGNGELYLVFSEQPAPPAPLSHKYAVYDRNGAQVSTFVLTGAPNSGSWTISLDAADYDADEREELLIRYHLNSPPPPNETPYTQDVLFMYEKNPTVGVEPGTTASRSVELGPSYPNPTFRLSRIEYSLPASGPATLRLFDVTGREVRTLIDGKVEAGRHEAIWDGRDGQGRQVPAGAYFYELNAGGQRASRRVVRLP